MAVDNPVTSQLIFTFKDNTYCVSHFHYGASGDTVKAPLGVLSAAVLVRTGTAPTTSVSAGDGSSTSAFDTVTLTGGTTNNVGCVLVTRHAANLAGAR